MYAKCAWKKYSEEQLKLVMEFNEEYKDYLTKGKTERKCVDEAIILAEKAGFKPLSSFEKLVPGDKVYVTNKGKNIACFVIGKKDIEQGLRVLGAHIDSPRIDVKQNPLYEKSGFALLDAHYYGGIKKYQWVTIPLAIHGVVCKKDGTVVNVCIGEELSDPVLGITDLLIHLSADQMQKTAGRVIEGEDLDLTMGNMPLKDEEKVIQNASLAVFLGMNNTESDEDKYFEDYIEFAQFHGSLPYLYTIPQIATAYSGGFEMDNLYVYAKVEDVDGQTQEAKVFIPVSSLPKY